MVTGSNFCGSVACGAVQLTDQNGKAVSVSRFIGYDHGRIEMEINLDKGQLRVAVGSSSAGYQYSAWEIFNHMSPVIDNKEAISLQRMSTLGGDAVQIQGRYFRSDNVQVWVGQTMGQVLSIEQLSAIGPHFYKVVALIPPGQGVLNKLYIKLPAAGSVTGAQSEPAMLNYKPPSEMKMNVHHFPTKGGTVDLTGMDLGLCAVLLVDGVQVQDPSGAACTNGRGCCCVCTCSYMFLICFLTSLVLLVLLRCRRCRRCCRRRRCRR